MSEFLAKQALALSRAIGQLPQSQQQSFVHAQALALAESLELQGRAPQAAAIFRSTIFEAISKERDYQDGMRGSIEAHPLEIGTWLMVMDVLLRQARDSFNSTTDNHQSLTALRKVLALGTACAEQNGLPVRLQSSKVAQHEQRTPARSPVEFSPFPCLDYENVENACRFILKCETRAHEHSLIAFYDET